LTKRIRIRLIARFHRAVGAQCGRNVITAAFQQVRHASSLDRDSDALHFAGCSQSGADWDLSVSRSIHTPFFAGRRGVELDLIDPAAYVKMFADHNLAEAQRRQGVRAEWTHSQFLCSRLERLLYFSFVSQETVSPRRVLPLE
jgi:hypothetical protein